MSTALIPEKTDGLLERILDLKHDSRNRFVSVSNTSDFVENQRNVSTKRMTEATLDFLSN